jgi:hypothetical protein
MKREAKLYIIGETYIKFDFDYSDLSKSLIKKAYLEQVGLKSRDFLKAKELIKVSIEYDKGSTKTRIIIWGTVVNIYLGIGNYGDFKSGVREIINDVKSFSTYVIDHIDDDPNINQNDILNTQRRTGLPGRINELYKRIESLEQNLNNLSNNEVQIELQEIKGEIANISEVLSGQERNSFLQSIDNNYKQNLPQPDNRKTTYLYNRYALKPEDDIEIIEE